MKRLDETLYKEYIWRRERGQIYETDYGFVTYKVMEREVFLSDIYVKSEERKSGHARKLVSHLIDIAKVNKIPLVTAKVYLEDKQHQNTLIAAFKIGFQIIQLQPDFIGLALDAQGESHG